MAKKRVSKRSSSKKKVSKRIHSRPSSPSPLAAEEESLTPGGRLKIPHLAPYQWKKGQSGNPAGRKPGSRNFKNRLWELLDQMQTKTGFTLEAFVMDAVRDNPGLLSVIVSKMLPNMTEDAIRPEDVQSLIDSVVGILTKHVKDKTILKRILADLEELDFEPEARG